MAKWEEVLRKFTDHYKDKDDVIGAVLCGSYATGNYTKNSDLDVFVITKEISYKQRGTVLIDGILVEYFINPLSEIYKYLENDFKCERTLIDANMYANGIILFDKNGEIQKLKEQSLKYYDMEFYPPDKNTMLHNNYICWDLMDEINDKKENNENYDLIYYMFLKELINNYYYKNKIASVPFTKIDKIYRNTDYRQKYHTKNMPPQEFIDLVLNVIDSKSYEAIEKLYKYVIEDFKITDFVLKAKI